MKKIILAAFLACITTVSMAQLPSFDLGIKAGFNTAKLNTDFAKEESRTGVFGGLWARIGAAGFFVQPEAYLGGKNSAFDFDSEGNNVEAKAKFTTLDIPILLGSRVGTKNFNVRFMAGPVISFIVNDKTTFSSAVADASEIRDYKDQTWGAQLGAGVDLGKITLDLRYEAGISNVSQSPKYEQKQNLWNFSLGYKIF